MGKYKDTPTENLKALLYALDIGAAFTEVKQELDRRHVHKKVLSGLKIEI